MRKSQASESSKPTPKQKPRFADDHRLRAARRRRDVPGELRDRLRRRLHEALDVAAGGEMLADRAHHDDAHARILVERLEHEAKLVALRHRHDVERRPVEDHVGALARRVDLDAEAVERREARIGESRVHAAVSSRFASISYSPATSLRRNSLPTGDFGIASTNT